MILKIKYNTKKIWKSSSEPFVLGEEEEEKEEEDEEIGRSSIKEFYHTI